VHCLGVEDVKYVLLLIAKELVTGHHGSNTIDSSYPKQPLQFDDTSVFCIVNKRINEGEAKLHYISLRWLYGTPMHSYSANPLQNLQEKSDIYFAKRLLRETDLAEGTKASGQEHYQERTGTTAFEGPSRVSEKGRILPSTLR
jgi:hypothetical protein